MGWVIVNNKELYNSVLNDIYTLIINTVKSRKKINEVTYK